MGIRWWKSDGGNQYLYEDLFFINGEVITGRKAKLQKALIKYWRQLATAFPGNSPSLNLLPTGGPMNPQTDREQSGNKKTGTLSQPDKPDTKVNNDPGKEFQAGEKEGDFPPEIEMDENDDTSNANVGADHGSSSRDRSTELNNN